MSAPSSGFRYICWVSIKSIGEKIVNVLHFRTLTYFTIMHFFVIKSINLSENQIQFNSYTGTRGKKSLFTGKLF